MSANEESNHETDTGNSSQPQGDVEPVEENGEVQEVETPPNSYEYGNNQDTYHGYHPGNENPNSYYSGNHNPSASQERPLTVDDDSNIEAKLFVGALSWQTTAEKLKQYFGQFGEVVDANVMYNKETGNPRGFGFVRFRDASSAEEVLKRTHEIDERTVDVKRSQPKGHAPPAIGKEVPRGSSGPSSGPTDPYKIFVGALPQELDDEGMKEYFSQYGKVEDCVVMRDKVTDKSRGFGFVTFANSAAVDKTLEHDHVIKGRRVDAKPAHPRGADSSGPDGGRRDGGPHRGGRGYGGYDQGGMPPMMPPAMMGGYGYGPPMDPAMAYYGYGDPMAGYGMYGDYGGYYGAAYGADYTYGDYGAPPMGSMGGPPPQGGGGRGGGRGGGGRGGGGPYRNQRPKRSQAPY